MIKRNVKNLAVEFAKLRPKPGPSYELWLEMVRVTSQHIPGNLSDAFVSACLYYNSYSLTQMP